MPGKVRAQLEALKKIAGNSNLLGLEDTSDPDTNAYSSGFDEDQRSPTEDWGATAQVPGMGDKPQLTKDSSGGKAMDRRSKEAALEKKATICIKIAGLMIPNGNDEAVQNMSVDLMHVPNKPLGNIATRLVLSRKGYKIAALKKAEVVAEEEKKVSAEHDELDQMSSIFKEADEGAGEYSEMGEKAVEEGESQVEVSDEVPPAEGGEEDELQQVSDILELEASVPAGKQAAQKLKRAKKASAGSQMSEDELITVALTNPDEDIDVSHLFKS